jgi:hypothetical protein
VLTDVVFMLNMVVGILVVVVVVIVLMMICGLAPRWTAETYAMWYSRPAYVASLNAGQDPSSHIWAADKHESAKYAHSRSRIALELYTPVAYKRELDIHMARMQMLEGQQVLTKLYISDPSERARHEKDIAKYLREEALYMKMIEQIVDNVDSSGTRRELLSKLEIDQVPSDRVDRTSINLITVAERAVANRNYRGLPELIDLYTSPYLSGLVARLRILISDIQINGTGNLEGLEDEYIRVIRRLNDTLMYAIVSHDYHILRHAASRDQHVRISNNIAREMYKRRNWEKQRQGIIARIWGV